MCIFYFHYFFYSFCVSWCLRLEHSYFPLNKFFYLTFKQTNQWCNPGTSQNPLAPNPSLIKDLFYCMNRVLQKIYYSLICLWLKAISYFQGNMGEYSLHLDLHQPLLLLQHKPSQENNKQMSGTGTAPSESSQALKQAGITDLVPRLEGRGQASAWLPKSLSRTRKTWQKLPLPVTFLPKHTGSPHLRVCLQVWTHKLRAIKQFLHWNHEWGAVVLSCALRSALWQETLHDWAPVVCDGLADIG